MSTALSGVFQGSQPPVSLPHLQPQGCSQLEGAGVGLAGWSQDWQLPGQGNTSGITLALAPVKYFLSLILTSLWHPQMRHRGLQSSQLSFKA